MAEFRLARRAELKLDDIYSFTEAHFGRYQADTFYAGCKRTFGLLADFLRMGPAADDLKAGYHRFRFQSHVIPYTLEAKGVFIRDIFHASQNIRPVLIE